MRANNQTKPTASKYNVKRKNKLKIVAHKSNSYVKYLSKIYTYLKSIIIAIGCMTSLFILGLTNYFASLNWKISFIPLMVAFLFIFLLNALKYRFKKI